LTQLGKKDFSYDEHYGIIEKWWIASRSYPPKREHLSATGILVEADGKPACVGFIYRTDSKICIFEFVVSNPEIGKEQRDAALTFLIESAKEWAKSNGFTLIYCSIGIQKYINRLEESGFIKADTNQTHIFYEVKQ